MPETALPPLPPEPPIDWPMMAIDWSPDVEIFELLVIPTPDELPPVAPPPPIAVDKPAKVAPPVTEDPPLPPAPPMLCARIPADN